MNNDTARSRRQDQIVIAVSTAIAVALWIAEWRPLAVFVGLFALAIAAVSSIGRAHAEREEERRQGQILKARGGVIEAAEGVLAVADGYRMGMPPELHQAIERLRTALANEGRAA
jgi:hypothetical protein